MAIQKQVWVSDIAENMFPDNSVINQSLDDSENLDNRTVNLPQAGSKPNVEVNRSSFPANVSTRVDSVISYDVDEFTTDPVVVRRTEEIEVSYDKRKSVLRDHLEALSTSICNTLLFKWAATSGATIVRTTGTDRPAAITGQTGTRKRMTLDEFIKARNLFDRMDIPQENRVACLTADHYSDLLADPELRKQISNPPVNLISGAVGTLMGFTIFTRSSTVMYTNASTPVLKAVGAAVGATDNEASMFWHPSYVRKAVGTDTNGGIEVFEQAGSPDHYGDIFSALVRGGGIPRYTDKRGIVSVVAAAGA